MKWPHIAAGDYAKIFTRGRPANSRSCAHFLYAHDLLMATCDLPLDATWLELGAGRGTTSQYLAARGCDVTLLDMCEAGLELAARNWLSEGMCPPKMYTGDAANTGFKDESYDCIYSIGLLEHFDDPRPLLAESLRLLKPGGLIWKTIFNVPSTDVDRHPRSREEYVAMMAELGMTAMCRPYPVQYVDVLIYRKPKDESETTSVNGRA